MRFKTRPAAYKDREGIVQLSSRIWDGDDYIPDLIDEWLNSSDPLYIVEDTEQERICAIDHCAVKGDYAYLEGLRVDPDYRGMGLGREVFRATLKETLRRGLTRNGALIMNESEASMHLARKMFFEPVNHYFFLEKKIEPEKKENVAGIKVREIYPGELERMKDEFHTLLMATGGFVPNSWSVEPEMAFDENKLIFESPEGKLVAGIHNNEQENFAISLFTKPGRWIEDLLPVLEGVASGFGCRRLLLTVPSALREWAEEFKQYGFKPLWEEEDGKGTRSIDDSVIYHVELNWNKIDRQVIPKQLNKKKLFDNYYRCSKRCRYGFPQVIESFPLKDGRPFPTTFYLTCPYLRYNISQLEEKGLIGELEPLTKEEDYKKTEQNYIAYRKRRVINTLTDGRDYIERYRETFESGIGGIKGGSGIKCLHLHTATYLAGMMNPVGRRVMAMLEENGVGNRCEDVDCFRFIQ